MLAGLTSAHAEGHPVVALACTRRSATTQPDRGGAWQATDLVEMARPITKSSALVTHAGVRVPELVGRLPGRDDRQAPAGVPGHPPTRCSTGRIDTAALRLTPRGEEPGRRPGTGRSWRHRSGGRLAGGVGAAVHLCRQGSALWAGASDELVALGDHLAAGISPSLGARGVVPRSHPHYFHVLDMQTTQAVRSDADVVLVVGARLGEYDGWGMPRMGRPGSPTHDPDRLRPALDGVEPAGRPPDREWPTPAGRCWLSPTPCVSGAPPVRRWLTPIGMRPCMPRRSPAPRRSCSPMDRTGSIPARW